MKASFLVAVLMTVALSSPALANPQTHTSSPSSSAAKPVNIASSSGWIDPAPADTSGKTRVFAPFNEVGMTEEEIKSNKSQARLP